MAFLPSVPRNVVPALLAAMDALYLGWPKRPIYRFGISPNKLVDYMMAGKPVIHGSAAANNPVAESGCGETCAPDDSSALANAIVQLRGRSDAEREAMGQRGRDYALAHHDYAVLARQFLDVLTGALRQLENPS